MAATGAAMLTVSLISLLVGVALGQRFKVMVLMPAGAMGLALAIGTGIAHGQSAWSIVLTAATAATCMQIGYLAGIGVRHLQEVASSRRSPPLPSPTPARHAAR